MEKEKRSSDIIVRKYAITLRLPLSNHGVLLHKNSLENVLEFFEQKKMHARTTEKCYQTEAIVKIIKMARSCGAEEIVDEVNCDKNAGVAEITFSFAYKGLLEKFERKLKEEELLIP